MAHARGAFFLAGAREKHPCRELCIYKGQEAGDRQRRASKEQMQHAIARELGLASPPEPHDVADALAVALCHYFASGNGITSGSRSVTFTGVNRAALFGPDPDILDAMDEQS